MALTLIEQVRLLIGDIGDNPVLTDDQVQFFLTTNNDDVDAAAQDAQVAVAQTLSIMAKSIRVEDLWEDSRDSAKRYNDAIDKSKAAAASSAYPIVGGGLYKGPSVDEFDEDNDWEDNDIFYNGYEDI
jgi:hypothetical protein